ncbi:FERM domain-containing protein 4B [Varanus komodoensis]|nr:FERM domain-containing protein 4B [Varanus komodoensis]
MLYSCVLWKCHMLCRQTLACKEILHRTDENARKDLKNLPAFPTKTLQEHPSLAYCEDRVIEHYIKNKGLTRGQAIVQYMKVVEALPTYGVHYYGVKDKQGIPWWLGISYKGIGQYDLQDKVKPRKLFQWKQLENLYFREKKFAVEVHDPRRISVSRRTFGQSGLVVQTWYANTSLIKSIWVMAISQHQFYLDRKQSKAKIPSARSLDDIAVDLTEMGTPKVSKLAALEAKNQLIMASNGSLISSDEGKKPFLSSGENTGIPLLQSSAIGKSYKSAEKPLYVKSTFAVQKLGVTGNENKLLLQQSGRILWLLDMFSPHWTALGVPSPLLLIPPLLLPWLHKQQHSETEHQKWKNRFFLAGSQDSEVSEEQKKEKILELRKKEKLLQEKLLQKVEELKKICLREAELTGKMPKEYPLNTGEKPPQVRRRVGTTFKLDGNLLPSEEVGSPVPSRAVKLQSVPVTAAVLDGSRGNCKRSGAHWIACLTLYTSSVALDPTLQNLESNFFIQQKLVEAVKKLAGEPDLCKNVKKKRKQEYVEAVKKLQEIENAINEYRIKCGKKPAQKSTLTLPGIKNPSSIWMW